MNYYRRYSGDYLRDTARLNLTEHGAYTLLMDYYYTDEQPLPADHAELYLMLRAMRPEDRKAVDKVLATFFTLEPDGYHQKRVDKEIATSQQARTNGKGHTGNGTGKVTGTISDEATGEITGTPTGRRTGKATGEGGGSGHPPTSNLQPPAATRQPLPAKRQGKDNTKGSRFARPDWVPIEPWDAYVEMRNRVGKPLTDRAKELAVIELEKLKGSGNDPTAVLEQSVFKSWLGLFEIKANGQPRDAGIEARNAEIGRRWAEGGDAAN